MTNKIKSKSRKNLTDIDTIPKIIIEDPENSSEASSYLEDESHLDKGEAKAIYFPINEDETRALLAYCHRQAIPVTISGARTGVVGGAVPKGGNVISLEKMNRILGIHKSMEEDAWLVHLEPGVRLQELQRFIEKKSLDQKGDDINIKHFVDDPAIYFYPPDPTEGTAMIGGTVAANSSGARSLAYGSTRNYVHRLRVVLANGDLLDITRGEYMADQLNQFEVVTSDRGSLNLPVPSYKMPQLKSAAGYYAKANMDLIDLFIGSEGSLGLITYIELKVIPRPKHTFSGLVFFSDTKNAFRLVQQIQKERLNPARRICPAVLEYFDTYSLELLRQKRQKDGPESSIGGFANYARAAVIFEQFCREEEIDTLYDSWQVILEANGVNMDDSWGGFEEKDLVKIKNFRHALPEILNEVFRQRKGSYPTIHKISADICVPDNAFEEMEKFYQTSLQKEGLEFVLFGHIGENHLHLNILPRSDEEMNRAKALNLQFAEKAIALGGTISAEHGIGKMKHRLLELLYGQNSIKEMVRIKLLLDPKGIINRGNIFSEEYLI